MNGLKKIAYNCKKATFLIEKKNLNGISIREQMELKLHLAGCTVCRLFQQQSLLIDRVIKGHFLGKDMEEPKLGEQFKKDMHQLIEQKLEEEN